MTSSGRAAENPNPGGVTRLASWLATLLVPLGLILTSVRLLLTPAFVQIEYRTPAFPADPYGFTRQDRLHWSLIALDYLLNDEGISFLGDLRFEDGTPVYNERELQHMVDVKFVLQKALVVWVVACLGLALLAVWAWRGNWRQVFRRSLVRGGWLTVILVLIVMAAVLIGFGVFFVFFHEVFFDPGTWIFRFSDTLIRLFPERFWRDTFLALGLLSLAGGLAFAYGFRSRPIE
jgi:integral membrane protein (TIGR01906 family)